MGVSKAVIEERDRVLIECQKSIKTFAKTFFPTRFRRPFSSKIHDPLFEILEDKTATRVCVIAPRGIGKSSIMSYAFPAHQLLFKEANTILPISATERTALRLSENLRRALTQNSQVKNLGFSPFLASKQNSKEQWQTRFGSWVVPSSYKMKSRGLLMDDFRPDLILPDDLEDPKQRFSESELEEIWDYLFGTIMPMIDVGEYNRIILIGTLPHENSIIQHLSKDPTFKTVRLEICDAEGNSNWPEKFSTEFCQQQKEFFERGKRLDLWNREYRGLLVSSETATFTREMFKYFEPTQVQFDAAHMLTFILCDPAKTINKRSDFTAIAGVTVDPYSGLIYLRDLIRKKMLPNELYDQILNMGQRLKANIYGIELSTEGEYIRQPFMNEASKRGIHVNLIELKPRGGDVPQGKTQRIDALGYYYRGGMVLHNRLVSEPLEEELLNHPFPIHDDASDCFAYTVQLMGKMDMLMRQSGFSEQSMYEYADKIYRDLGCSTEEDSDSAFVRRAAGQCKRAWDAVAA